MSQTNTNKNEPKPPADLPLLRMLHPTSGRNNYNPISNQVPPLGQSSIDPQQAAILQWQTQRAIATAAASPSRFNAFPYQNSFMPQYSPYMYGIYQPYSYYQRR